jgi:hypothetical protein
MANNTSKRRFEQDDDSMIESGVDNTAEYGRKSEKYERSAMRLPNDVVWSVTSDLRAQVDTNSWY